MRDGQSKYILTTGWGQDGLGAGLDSVFSAATLALQGGGDYAGTYLYFYDAFGRRRAKVMPWSTTDEYFHDVGHQLLSDKGGNTIGQSPTEFPEVDYVWLGGRPILGIQGKFNAAMARYADGEGNFCNRNGAWYLCGIRHIVTDVQGKPVAVLDDSASARTSATLRYDAYGYVNRRPAHLGSQHYQPNNYPVATFVEPHPAGTGWDSYLRVLFQRTQGSSTATLAGTQFSMGDASHRWSPLTYSTTGNFLLSYAGNYWSWGFDAEAYEFRLKEAGIWWWVPNLRFPGHYFDEETELHENWNRYYDPATGRYLSPEPMLQNPWFVAAMAREGRTTPAYAYAANNPVKFIDPDGNFAWTIPFVLYSLGADVALGGTVLAVGIASAVPSDSDGVALADPEVAGTGARIEKRVVKLRPPRLEAEEWTLPFEPGSGGPTKARAKTYFGCIDQCTAAYRKNLGGPKRGEECGAAGKGSAQELFRRCKEDCARKF